MLKILFIHGLASSGQYKMADMLRMLLKPCEVISPDVPIEPQKAMELVNRICEEKNPDLIVGMSMGGFIAQKMRGRRKVLINPDFHIANLMSTMTGEVKYLSPRKDGAESFILDMDTVNGWKKMEEGQFTGLTPEEKALSLGFFADADEMVRCGDEFETHYPGRGITYPGGHLPTYPQMKQFIIPAIKEWIQEQTSNLQNI